MNRLLPPVACILLAAAAPALSAELPTRKAGLWEMKMLMEQGRMPPLSMQHCTDAAADKLMTSNFGSLGREECSKRDIQVSGHTVTVDSVCTFGGATITTHALITGDFNSAYTIKIMSMRDGGATQVGIPGAGGRESNMTIEAKYAGACKEGQKPGDMIMPGGKKVNVLDLQKLQLLGGGGRPKGAGGGR